MQGEAEAANLHADTLLEQLKESNTQVKAAHSLLSSMKQKWESVHHAHQQALVCNAMLSRSFLWTFDDSVDDIH